MKKCRLDESGQYEQDDTDDDEDDEDSEGAPPVVVEFPDESTGSNSVEFVEIDSPQKQRGKRALLSRFH